jgi:hypothetical protein
MQSDPPQIRPSMTFEPYNPNRPSTPPVEPPVPAFAGPTHVLADPTPTIDSPTSVAPFLATKQDLDYDRVGEGSSALGAISGKVPWQDPPQPHTTPWVQVW